MMIFLRIDEKVLLKKMERSLRGECLRVQWVLNDDALKFGFFNSHSRINDYWYGPNTYDR